MRAKDGLKYCEKDVIITMRYIQDDLKQQQEG